MNSAPGPLCPELYELLEERFGEVGIGNEGEEIDAVPTVDAATGRVRWDIRQRGEYYMINCPFCNDTRKRLLISYCYGQVDPTTMRAAIWLANCFNEGCLRGDAPSGYDNRLELEQRIFLFQNRQDRVGHFQTSPGHAVPPTLREIQLPGRVITLDRITRNHPAAMYVEDRGFDPARLGHKYGVGYCVEADPLYPAARGRIIIPIVMDGVLVGWQGRWPDELDWKARGIPKYYNLPRMPKKLMLYNVDRAQRGRIVIVVEGITGVWALGDAAVALLGKEVSASQRDLLINRWAKRGTLLVLLLDPDAETQTRRHFPVLENTFFGYEGGAAFAVRLPDGKDPADLQRDTIWDMIYAAGDALGIDVASYCGGG